MEFFLGKKHVVQTNGGSFLVTVRAFLLTVDLFCLQSVEVLIRCTFPL